MPVMVQSLRETLKYLEATRDCLWRRSQNTNFKYSPKMKEGFEEIAAGFDKVIKALEEQKKNEKS